MRFKWDEKKNDTLKKARGMGFDEVLELFEKPYHLSQKNDDPEQWRAIGWVKSLLFAVIYEEREDEEGLFYWLVTFWPATKTERKLYDEAQKTD